MTTDNSAAGKETPTPAAGADAVAAAAAAAADPKPAADAAAAASAEGAKPADGAAAAATPAAGAAGTKDTKDDKTAAGAASGTKDGKDAAAAAAPKPPDKYTLTLPAGGRLSDADLKDVEAIARTNGWTNDQAQAALTEHARRVDAQATAWLEQTKADPDLGGDKLEASQTLAKGVIDRIRPAGHPRREAFMGLLNRAGVGNHPEVVAFLRDLGTLMAEDKPPVGGPGGGKRSPEEVLYGKQS